MEWFEELEFENNPFNLNPLETDFGFIGRDKEAKELLYRIISGNMLLVEGKAGTGKTALLKYAIDNFKGKGRVIYVNANKLNKRLNISNLLKKKPKGMILLMDNVQYLSKKNNERIKYYYDQDYIKSVVFTTTDYSLVNFTNAVKNRIGRNIIKLKNISQNNTLKTAKERLNNNKILPDDVLKQLYKDSNNIKEFLINCDLLCGYLVEKGKEKAKKEDIKKIPKERIEEEKEKETEMCLECDEKLVKVGEYWRCKNCDQYCTGCGALIDDEDEYCPECGAKFEEEE
ncbi:MAG: DUF815 domain-containing protein [Nanoarchaeota archaeon]|nr:DUF815 domain-containing protein [Nanoarchaeota archaeon]